MVTYDTYTSWAASTTISYSPWNASGSCSSYITTAMSPSYGQSVLDFLEYTRRNTAQVIRASRDNTRCTTRFTNINTDKDIDISDNLIANIGIKELYEYIESKGFFYKNPEYAKEAHILTGDKTLIERLREEIKDWCGGILE